MQVFKTKIKSSLLWKTNIALKYDQSEIDKIKCSVCPKFHIEQIVDEHLEPVFKSRHKP